MKHPTKTQSATVKLTVLLAALAAFTATGQAQSIQQLTNGLVSYYPLDQLSPGTTNKTPDLISRRDLLFTPAMSSANIIAGSHPGMGDSTAIMNLSQTAGSGGNTIMTYQSSGQNPLTGAGDFLPFINQRGATMNFWIKGAPAGDDSRAWAECANNGDGNPFFSLSNKGTGENQIGYFLRTAVAVTDPNGVTVIHMDDGTYNTPAFAGTGNYIWSQADAMTTNVILDNTWHMLTTVIATNGDLHVFVDGIYDPGAGTHTDSEGNPAVAVALAVTNTYYTTNNYPLVNPPTTNPPPNGYVRYMVPGLNDAGAFDAFGGYERNGSFGAPLVCQMSDIGFWNRPLSTNEIQWLMTNGISGVTLNPNVIVINSFTADFGEIGQGNTVTLHWNITGASSSPGGIVISGVGDVSGTSVGSTNITLGKNASYSFTLTAHNGVVADKFQTVTVKTFAGVPKDWHAIQRFDGLFSANTTAGVNANGWVSLLGYYNGALDRFNVVTVNGNKVLSPSSGYQRDANSPFGFDTLGSLSFGNLNGLTLTPTNVNTLFFRFSLRDPMSMVASNGIYSGLDFTLGVSDQGFIAPIGGTQPPGQGGTAGPGFHILRYDSSGAYLPTPFDLTADNYSGSSVTNSYDYLTAANGNPNGLQTNVTYYCWLDISNNNTMGQISGGVTNTINEPLYSLWIQKQGDPSRTQLFSNFGGDRNYADASATPYLNKVFVSVATENILASDNGAFFETNNMILLDDFYLSANGYDSTIPRLFNLTSIVRNPTNAVIQWESLGSMFQINTYSVQRTLSLSPASWVTLTNGLPSGGDFTSYTDSTVGGNTAFYRISWP